MAMTNDDANSAPLVPSPPQAASAAFTQAMTGVATRRQQLAAAISDHDFEGVMSLARIATDLWLAGRAACRRLAERNRNRSPYIEAARALLEKNYMDLLETFAQATRTIAVPRMARLLAELRATLMRVMAEPLGATATAESDERKST